MECLYNSQEHSWVPIPPFETLRAWDLKVGISGVLITQCPVSVKGKARRAQGHTVNWWQGGTRGCPGNTPSPDSPPLHFSSHTHTLQEPLAMVEGSISLRTIPGDSPLQVLSSLTNRPPPLPISVSHSCPTSWYYYISAILSPPPPLTPLRFP